MSDEQVQTSEEVVNAFYPDAEAEPLEAPTDEVLTDEEPVDAEEDSTEVVDEESEEADESEGSEEEADDIEDVQTIELDGTEHNLTDIQEWKEAHDNVKLMQADCTKKWTEAADLKKEAESQSSKAQDLILELEVLIGEDRELSLESLVDIDSEYYDPDKYAELKPKAEKREAKLKELKANQPKAQQPLTQEEILSESHDFHAYDPAWRDGDTLTPKFTEDMTMAGIYLKEAGYSQDEVNAISYSHHWKTILDAAKYKALQSKKQTVKKKLVKTPKASKPQAQTKTMSAEEIFYGK